MAPDAVALTNLSESRTVELDRLRRRADDLREAIGRDVEEVRSRVRGAFDLRRQAAIHPFFAAAVVLGGLFVATRLVKSLLRGDRAPEAKRLRK